MNRQLRNLLIVASVFLVFSGIYVYRLVPRGKTPFDQADKKASHFTLAYGALRVELKKEGEAWSVMTSSGPAVADPERVKAVLTTLGGVTLENVISHSAAQAPLFEVTEASGTHVTVWNAKGKLQAEGLFGKQAPDFSHIYFRFHDHPEVYLASGLFRSELNPGKPEDWKKEKAERR